MRRIYILALLIICLYSPNPGRAWWAEWLGYDNPMVSGNSAYVAYETQLYLAGRDGHPPPALFIANIQTGQTTPLTHDVKQFEVTPWGEVPFSTFWGVFLTASDGTAAPRWICAQRHVSSPHAERIIEVHTSLPGIFTDTLHGIQ